MEAYNSLEKFAQIELIEKKSRFIAWAAPLSTVDEAQAMLEDARNKYPDATHHVSAWRLSLETFYQRYSDDGEPKGTAGLPVLDVLTKQELTECGIIVIRYFGGVKLGAGGLVRAYSAAAAEAVRAAKIIRYEKRSRYKLTVSYSLAETIHYQLAQLACAQGEQSYGINVEWVIAPKRGAEEKILDLIKEISSNSVLIEEIPAQFMAVK
ncbi:MAG: YigZ family protein [Eubacteriales bacterium]|nr:YigZ family protein [Eubacteriales bacterium]